MRGITRETQTFARTRIRLVEGVAVNSVAFFEWGALLKDKIPEPSLLSKALAQRLIAKLVQKFHLAQEIFKG